jgi:dipeptidyl aminopeptidase/acylaminoacyl peptidase
MLGMWKGIVFAALIGLAGQSMAQVDIEPYLKRDNFGTLKISPDGLHYAATVPMEDRTGLVILRRSDKKLITKAIGVKGSEVDGFWWVNDERVVVAMAERFGSRDEPYATGELHAVGLGSEIKRLIGIDNFTNVGVVIGEDREFATLIDTLPDDPRNVLISVWDTSNPQTRIEKLDTYTGRRKPIAIAPLRHAHFVADASGEVRFAIGSRDDNLAKTYYRDNKDAEWRLINDEAETGFYELPLAFAADGVTAYLQVEQNEGPDAIVAFDTRTGTRTPVQRDDVVDPFALLRDRETNALAAIQYMDGGIRTRFVDEQSALAGTFGRLEKAFPGHGIDITSYTRDGGLILFQVWNDRAPGDYYLYDTRKRTASGVLVQREWFNPAAMSRSRAITIKARDGLELHGYLTVPHGKEAKSLPTVVMPHGGPFGIFDEWTFDDDTQLLAQAGYAVLRINFRGSGNFGSAFRAAGAKDWGGRMQDDVTDATRWAIEQHIADPTRICIYGASYGGYAALMGVAKEPELYRCAVGYVGVYDLEAMHRDDSRLARSAKTWVNDWVGERSGLGARSPTALANRIKAPVFLAAGGKDTRAHRSQQEDGTRVARGPGAGRNAVLPD